MAPSLTTRLVTPRLLLRPPRTGDVAEIRRLTRANQEHLKPWNPAPPPGDDPSSITEVSKTVLRQDGTNLYSSLTTRQWFSLAVGGNHIRLEATGTTSATIISLRWRRRWLSI